MITLRDRIKRITQLVELGRMHATVRMDAGKTQIGILIRDDEHVWGDLPSEVDPNEDTDQRFAEDLVKRAREAAR